MNKGTQEDPHPYNFLLRDVRSDEIAAQPCKTCKVPLSTYRDLAAHEEQHVTEGTLVAIIGPIQMTVSFQNAENWAKFYEGRNEYRLVPLTPEQVDWSSNAARVVCPQCGEFVHLKGQRQEDGSFVFVWEHYRMRPLTQLMTNGQYMVDWKRDGNAYLPDDHQTDIPLPNHPSAEKEHTS